MPNLESVNATKEKIISNIQTHGPTYPAKISRDLAINPIFAAAFLSELISDKRLKTSNLKVGSSHLYFIPGQENKLENFASYLNHKEREAFELLKKNNILDDAMQDPAIRVALRKINDFAVQLSVKLDNAQEKIFWKYYSLTDEQTKDFLENLINPKQKQKAPEVKETKAKEEKLIKQEAQETLEKSEVESEKKVKTKSSKKAPKESEFVNNVKDFLSAKDIEILKSIVEKPKEFTARVRIDTLFGKQEYLLQGKDKKKITEDDLAIALHKANAEKVPALIITSGILDDEAKAYLEHWKNLIKIEKMK